jgi:hypothetical protein
MIKLTTVSGTVVLVNEDTKNFMRVPKVENPDPMMNLYYPPETWLPYKQLDEPKIGERAILHQGLHDYYATSNLVDIERY